MQNERNENGGRVNALKKCHRRAKVHIMLLNPNQVNFCAENKTKVATN
jgi:hypothetical protein